ncbi:hypothetical protein [Aliikangiella maris]|uniref:Uncharacterized protein n=2 Tax=Aliikangiella maris TaxID=3162458 RepID=A0ABV3MJC0_9GAMM
MKHSNYLFFATKPAYVLFFSFLVLILTGCTSIPPQQINDRMNAWRGINIDELIKFWGLPTKQTEANGKKYAEWLNQTSEQGNTSVSIGTGHRGSHTGIGIGLSLFNLGGNDDACSRLVTYTPSGMVTDISWQGTGKYCYELTPDLDDIKSNQAARGIKK